MEGIIDLHHDIIFFLIVVVTLVGWMLTVVIAGSMVPFKEPLLVIGDQSAFIKVVDLVAYLEDLFLIKLTPFKPESRRLNPELY